MYRARGDVDRALADYSAALRLDPANADAFYGRGLTLARKRNYAQAIADFTVVLALKQEFAELYFARAAAHEDNGDADAAIADYGNAIRLRAEVRRRLQQPRRASVREA